MIVGGRNQANCQGTALQTVIKAEVKVGLSIWPQGPKRIQSIKSVKGCIL